MKFLKTILYFLDRSKYMRGEKSSDCNQAKSEKTILKLDVLTHLFLNNLSGSIIFLLILRSPVRQHRCKKTEISQDNWWNAKLLKD